ncbi:tripartite tricarboxylate transporter substrate binding protein [soil metagenome]
MSRLKTALLAAGLATACLAANAETPVRLVIPAPAGGGTDGFFRTVAQEAEKTLGAPIVVVNVGGAGGTIGVSQVIRAAPDGKTLAAVWSSPVTAAPHAIKSYKPQDFTAIIQISSAPYVMCVANSFPGKTGAAFIEELRRNPDKYTYGNDGIGGTGQLASERIFRAVKVSVRDVPFKGAGETLTNFLGGHVDIYVGSILPVMPHLKAGKVACPLVTSAARAASLPDSSGLADIGIPGEETLLWRGILAPNGIAPDTAKQIEHAFETAAQQPAVRKFAQEAGEEIVIRKGPELQKMIDKEFEALGAVAKSLNIQPQ